MKQIIAAVVIAGAALLSGINLGGQTAGTKQASAPPPNGRATPPRDVVWETNNDDPPIGSPEAMRGGTFNFFITSYPLTFRLMGPNSNDAFAGWNRLYTMNFPLVGRHPVTDRFIPVMATHWSVQAD